MSATPYSRVIRFGSVGAMATAIHVTIALLVSGFLGFGNLSANLVGYCTAWSVSYLGNYYWTFLTKSRHAVSLPRFMLISLTCLVASLAIVQGTTYYLAWPFFVSQIIVIAIIPVTSFALSALWVFRPAQRGNMR